MAQRPIWRGHLRLALVSCPVALYSARHDRGTIRFNMINPKTGNRIRMVSVDAGTDEEISRGETVKGYEYSKGRYVIITDDDMDKVKVESSSTMAIEKFVDAASIDPIYYDASYFLAPDGKSADDVYAVVREAVVRTGRVALTRIVISQRERTVAIRPIGGGLVAHTLNEQRDLNEAKTLFDTVQGLKVDPEMVKLAVQLVDRQTGTYDPSDLEDRYETRLREMLEAKVNGETVDGVEVASRAPDNVVDIMAALRQSLGLGQSAAGPPKTPAVRKGKTAKPGNVREQAAFKLPIAGGKTRAGQPGAGQTGTGQIGASRTRSDTPETAPGKPAAASRRKAS